MALLDHKCGPTLKYERCVGVNVEACRHNDGMDYGEGKWPAGEGGACAVRQSRRLPSFQYPLTGSFG
jgi:hypothetical protein